MEPGEIERITITEESPFTEELFVNEGTEETSYVPTTDDLSGWGMIWTFKNKRKQIAEVSFSVASGHITVNNTTKSFLIHLPMVDVATINKSHDFVEIDLVPPAGEPELWIRGPVKYIARL